MHIDLKLKSTNTKDSIIFQINEDFLEVGAIRYTNFNDVADTMAEIVYKKRVPNLTDKGMKKRSFNDLAKRVEDMSHTLIVAEELKHVDFNIGGARAICFINDPLAKASRAEYFLDLKDKIKITTKILSDAVKKGEKLSDDIDSIPKRYAIFSEKVSQIKLNGYLTPKVLNRWAKTINIEIVKELIVSEFWQGLVGVLDKTFNRDITYTYKELVVELDDPILYREIYTAGDLQAITNAIL